MRPATEAVTPGAGGRGRSPVWSGHVRPKRLRRVVAAGLGGAAIGFWLLLTMFQQSRPDVTAVAIVLGGGPLVAAWTIAAAIRMEYRADAVRIRNVLHTVTVPWSEVDSIDFDGTTRWAIIRLHTGQTITSHALDRWDGPRAFAAVQHIRRILIASRE